MFGQNKKLPAVNTEDGILYVHKIFKTIQAEGPYAGMPAIFIRLSGCNLACSFCDTEFEDFNEYKQDDLLKKVADINQFTDQIYKPVKLIVISGGEPMRQSIGSLVQALIDIGYIVQIETNGTIYRQLPEEVKIICSPKVVNGKYLSIRPDLLPHITALKFLISATHQGYQTVPNLGQEKYNIPIYVQPMDEYNPELNKANKKLACDLAIQHGYMLSYQIHKELDIE